MKSIIQRGIRFRGGFLLAFVVISIVSLGASRAQEVSITTKLDRGEMQIGEQALITLKIRTGDLDNTFLIVPPDTALHRAEALSFAVTDTVDIGEKVKEITAKMVITSFDSTLVEIPAFGVRVGSREVFANPLYLKVTVPKVDLEHPETFSPNKEQWRLPYTFSELLLIALPWLLIALCLVGGYFLFRYIKRKRELRKLRPAFVAPPRALTPIEILREQVTLLSAVKESERYYSALDLALRDFLVGISLSNALEMTSRQLLRALQHLAKTGELVPQFELPILFAHFDMAKFAQMQYGDDTARSDAERVLAFAEALWQITEAQRVAEKRSKKGEAEEAYKEGRDTE